MSFSKLFYLLFFLIIIKSLLLVWWVSAGTIGLGPDEAQYWTWSQALDWGYYSKPPGIAYQIWAGTALFGNTELGVRFGSILLGSLITLAMYWFAKRSGLSDWAAFLAGIVLLLSPIGVMASFLAITDIGMVLFWVIASGIVAGSIYYERNVPYLHVGIVIALGALFKWPIYFLWFAILIGWPFLPSMRSSRIIPGVLVSLLGLMPSVIWNAQHDWVTFRHVLATLTGRHFQEKGTTVLAQGNSLEFIGAQIVLLSPIFFAFLILAWIYILPRKNELTKAVWWCALTSCVFLSAFAFVGLFQKMQGNWCIFIYPQAIVALVALVDKKNWNRAFYCGVAFSVVFVVAILFAAPYIPLKRNPFKYNLGWKELAPALEEAEYDPEHDFLFADSYQMASILSFYGPKQKRAYFLNMQGSRLNQFSFWPSLPEKELHKTGFFVSTSNICTDTNKLKPYFKDVECKGVFPLTENGKEMVIFQGEEYNGKVPETLLQY